MTLPGTPVIGATSIKAAALALLVALLPFAPDASARGQQARQHAADHQASGR